MKARTVMLQGTSSSVGKSLLTAALCRVYRRQGFDVVPFKAQNMALNSYVTRDGLEMGRAQVVQAEAAGVEPTIDMNPVLLKPETGARCQVVVRGRPVASLSAEDYFAGRKLDLWPVVVEALDRLRSAHELVVIEGAGSPAEINLRDKDIVNMRVARHAASPVLLVGDIDRGGVFAALLGTLEWLFPEERALVRGFIINKFRGDVRLLEPAPRMLAERTGVPVLGVVPYARDLGIAEEDSVALDERRDRPSDAGGIDIAVLRMPHISNFDDFDPFEREPGVSLRYVDRVESLGKPDLVILPGTKATLADLDHLRATGLAAAVLRLADSGAPMIGICGGYQILGLSLHDPAGVESDVATVVGLGLLPVETTFEGDKRTHRVEGRVLAGPGLAGALAGQKVVGYEIHSGRTVGGRPAIGIDRRLDASVTDFDGAVGDGGLVLGTYVHGLFADDGLRRALLAWLAGRKRQTVAFAGAFSREAAYDRLADLVEASLDMPALAEIVGLKAGAGEASSV
jgi:adenosylcobyric acid synthase